MTAKLQQFVVDNTFDRATLVVDIDQVALNYQDLKRGLGSAHIHYAVKSNPHPAILETLVNLGSKFDAASRREIELCLEAGAHPEHISFGNTIKRPQDIAWAHNAGILLFSADAEQELEKISTHAPGSSVFIRILVQNSAAEWPLSRKFGCRSDHALALMALAKNLGLDPVGLSFHVGSQTRHPEMWESVLENVAQVWHSAKEAGYNMRLLNIGGGFPTEYDKPVTPADEYSSKVMQTIGEKFGDVYYVMAEPGRAMVGNAGMLASTVLLTSKKHPEDSLRWVYLDVGKFSGLAETEGESIKYRFWIPGKETASKSKCILAGPTCDSADVLYEKNPVELPDDLQAGDKFVILSTGAYTTTYSSVAFNGFPPLESMVI